MTTNYILMENDSIALREHLKPIIANGENEVVFEKADGSVRVLKCTRDPEIIGLELFEKYTNPPPKKDGKPRVESTSSLPVFDLESKSWKSFSFLKLISVNGINTDVILQQANIILI